MGFLSKLFGSNNNDDDDDSERNPYGRFQSFNYPFSQRLTSFILKLMDEGEWVYNYTASVVVVMGEFHYVMWNNNHPYAWLSKCEKYWQVPIVKEQKIETSLWLPNPYEKVTTYEWKNSILWNKLLPEPWAMWKFEKWCLKNGIIVGMDEKGSGESNMDTEFMDKILSSSNNKEGEKD